LLGSVGSERSVCGFCVCMGAPIHFTYTLGWVGLGLAGCIATRSRLGCLWGLLLVVGLFRDTYTMLLIPPLFYPAYTVTRCYLLSACCSIGFFGSERRGLTLIFVCGLLEHCMGFMRGMGHNTRLDHVFMI